MFRIFSTALIPPESLKTIPKEFSVDIFPKKRPMEYAELYEKVASSQYDGLLCTYRDRIDAALLKSARKRLKVIATMSSGTDRIDLAQCQNYRIEVHNVPNATTNAVADYGIALLLLGVRRLDLDLQHQWDKPNGQGVSPDRRLTICEAVSPLGTTGDPWYYLGNLKGFSLSQLTIGIVGLGNIGTAIARRLTRFGSRITYYSPQRKRDVEQKYGVQFVSFERLLVDADAIIVCCSLNSDTQNLFALDTFEKMKPSSIFINIARGEVCNQNDLYRALASQTIGMALLDVTNPEPFPLAHPLNQLENCLIFPHIATNVRDSRIDLCNLALQKIYSSLTNPLAFNL